MVEVSVRSFLGEFLEPAIRVWRGEERLSKAFWVYGVFVSSVLILRYTLALYQGRVALQQVLLLCFGGFTVWVLVSIWRCANQAEKTFEGLVTQWLIVSWAVNIAMLLDFLQLDLVATYFGRWLTRVGHNCHWTARTFRDQNLTVPLPDCRGDGRDDTVEARVES